MTESNYIPQPPAYGPQLPPAPAPQPAPPARAKRKWILPVAMLVGGLIIGSASAGSAAANKPEPAVATPAPVETKTVTETVEVEVTPQVCIDALDKASEVVGIMAKIPPLASDAIKAAATMDSATLDRTSTKVKAANEELDALAPSLGTTVSECRAKAK